MAKQKIKASQIETPYKSQINGSTSNAILSPGTTQYIGISCITTNPYALPISFNGTIKRLYCWVTSSPGVGKIYECTIMKNNVATAVATNIVSGTNVGTDLTHTVAVAAGDRISLRTVITAGATAMSMEWSVEFDAD